MEIPPAIVIPPEPPPEANERLYRCPKCRDTLFIAQVMRTRFGETNRAWFCTCDAARSAEAGYWFDKVYVASAQGIRARTDTGKAALEEYLKAKPERYYVRSMIEELLNRYNQRLKRRASGLDE